MHRRSLILSAAAALAAGPALPQAYLDGGTLVVPEPPGEGALRMRDLYEKDMSFSALAESLQGERIEVEGFMAPPLDADADWFVLTKRPMAVCPFCETEADWPRDILKVQTKRVLRPVSFNRRIEVSGVLELGSERDPETGFLSRVRLTDAVYDAVA